MKRLTMLSGVLLLGCSFLLVVSLGFPTVSAENPTTEWFYDIDHQIKDLDNDGHDDTITFDYDPDTNTSDRVDIKVDIDVYLDESYYNTVSEQYTISDGEVDSLSQNWSADQNGTYDFKVILYDEQGNQEDWYNVSDVNLTKLGPRDRTINVDAASGADDDDELVNDLSFFAHIEDEQVQGAVIRLFRNSLNVATNTTGGDGQAEFANLTDGDYTWDVSYNGSQLLGEGGLIHIAVAGQRGAVGFLHRFDGNDDYNDLYIAVTNETGDNQADGYFELYNETDELTDSGNTNESYGWYENVSISHDLPKGNYTYFIYQEENGQLLQNGSVHAYPNGSGGGGGAQDYDEYFWDIYETLSDEDDDRENDTVTFSYDIDVDDEVYSDVTVQVLVTFEGTLLENFSADYTIFDGDAQYLQQNYTANTTGNYTFEVLLFDDQGRQEDRYDTEVLELVAQGEGVHPPTAEIVQVRPRPANEAEEVEFKGQGDDEDGTIEAYEWESSLDGVFGTQATIKVDSLSVGDHDIYFRVQDNDGVWSDRDFVSLEIHNRAPTATILSPTETVFNPGTMIYFSGSGHDVRGPIQGYIWESSLDGQLSLKGNFSTDNLSIGTHQIKFRVQDDEGEWSNSDYFDLRINEQPVARTGPPSPQLADEGQVVHFAGQGSDSDGGLVGYEWRSSLGGHLSDQRSFSLSNLSLGNHTIYYRVLDDDGLWSDWVSTYVLINGLPRVTILSVQPQNSNLGEMVQLRSSVFDPDGYVVELEWLSSLDGELLHQANFSTDQLSSGIHVLSLRAQDNLGSWSEKVTTTITVNSLPEAIIDSIDQQVVKEGEMVQFIGMGNDPDGTIEAYAWRSSLDGPLSSESYFDTDGLSPGNHTIYLKVRDDAGVWSPEVSVTLTVERKSSGGGGGGGGDGGGNSNTLVLAAVGIVAVLALGGGGYFMYQRNQAGGPGGPGAGTGATTGAASGQPGQAPAQEPTAVPGQPQIVACPHCASQMSVTTPQRPVVLTCPSCSGQLTVN